jgi:hypothetical protein
VLGSGWRVFGVVDVEKARVVFLCFWMRMVFWRVSWEVILVGLGRD